MRPRSRLEKLFLWTILPPPRSTLFPYTTLFRSSSCQAIAAWAKNPAAKARVRTHGSALSPSPRDRSEEHTSELQSQFQLVCRLLPEKKNTPRKLPPSIGSVATTDAYLRSRSAAP